MEFIGNEARTPIRVNPVRSPAEEVLASMEARRNRYNEEDRHREEDRRRKEEEMEELRKEDETKRWLAMINVGLSIMAMYRRHKDPMTRHILFLDKFSVLIIGLMEILKTFAPELKVDQTHDLDKLTTMIREELEDLTDWVINAKEDDKESP